ncbi:hypothetical protein BC351_40040 [Paenibacillus ferrarius]|uniref:Uncharacterized protein n=1 Tax=Paenibacillus ferrarius TaxID=1469647 RepID=A0A1V4H8B8_9BACL|nr:hypothetical protein [Paenibacillus ferrarius]OPH47398.1 hypothetical protein BC351_40040 [Paenibacillus ferrarius]
MSEKEEVLTGGNVNKIIRVGDTIRRDASNNPYVNDLLIYLEKNGFNNARPLKKSLLKLKRYSFSNDDLAAGYSTFQR